MAQEQTSDILSVDDFYFSALVDQNPDEIFPVSDEKYAEELQLQEAIMASVIASQMQKNPSSSKTQETPPSSSNPPEPEPEPELNHQIPKEIGESSQIFCEICAEMKEIEEIFRTGTCSHSFCTDCISKHVAAKIQDNINTVICPGLNCKGVLELDACRRIIPENVLLRWSDAVSESMILASQKFYCPYKDCSAVLENDNGGEMRIRESECPVCRRLFCAECHVPWHSGVDCEEFQRLNEDERGKNDLMVMELAKENKWRRCSHCKYIVEKTEGCLHIVCRCGFEFCYGCGGNWTQHQGGCQQ